MAKKRKVVPSIVGGFVLALLEMGLPMIGVSVNLWLGGIVLAVAFALFAWGLWNWETNHHYDQKARAITLVVVGVIYFPLMGFQIYSQYKKDHPAPPLAGPEQPPPVAPAPTPKQQAQQPKKPDCADKTGNATASGGSIANTGCGDSDFSVDGKPKRGSGEK